METELFSINELQFARNFLTINISPVYNDNVAIKKIFDQFMQKLYIYFFNWKSCFSIQLEYRKGTKVNPIYERDDSSDVSNCRPIPVLPCFSIISKCIMHNCLCKYLIENKILYSKQFGFRNGHSIDNAKVQFVDQVCESFDSIKYTLGAFINLPKTWHCSALRSHMAWWTEKTIQINHPQKSILGSVSRKTITQYLIPEIHIQTVKGKKWKKT